MFDNVSSVITSYALMFIYNKYFRKVYNQMIIGKLTSIYNVYSRYFIIMKMSFSSHELRLV